MHSDPTADSALVPTLLLVDGLSLVRRVYEAVPGDDGPEKVEGALKSSWQSIQRALREHTPTHFLAAFDVEGPTWRHALYPAYQADRTPMPAGLRAALPSFLRRLDDGGLRSISVPGVEADDTLATLSVKAVQRGFRTVVLSSDKDLCQLVASGVLLRDHFKAEWRDEDWIQAKFGVPACLIGDYLALMGDAADGVPGVASVGKTRAAALLAEFGNLEGVLEASVSIKGKLGEQLRSSHEIARLSRALVSLKMDVVIGVTPNEMRVPIPLLAPYLASAPVPEEHPAEAPRRHRL